MESGKSIRWDDVAADEVLDGVVRQRYSGATFTVVRYTYQPGSVFPLHMHPEEQLTIVHSGEIEFTVGGEKVVLKEGMLATIPAGVPHGARVTGDVAVVSDNYIASPSRSGLEWVEESLVR
ncbi:MAG: cupin domain-containing protein [Thermomicrobiales bacterium]